MTTLDDANESSEFKHASVIDSQEQKRDDAFAQLDRAIESIGAKKVHFKLFLIVAFGGLFNVIEQFNIGYVGPLIMDQWGLTTSHIGTLSMATFLAMAAGAALTGFLADRFGRKPLFLANILIYSLGSLLAAFAPDYEFLLVARIVVGIGLGGEMALGYTMISELMPTSKRAAGSAAVSLMHGGVGIWASAALAALILGPVAILVGGPEIAWRVFLGIMVVPAVLVLIARRFMPETPRYLIQMGKFAEVNAILAAIQDNRMRLRTEDYQASFISADSQISVQPKLSVTEILSRKLLPRTLIAWALAITLFASVATLTTFLPTIVVELGYDPAGSAGIAALITFGGVIGGTLGIFLGHRFPRRFVLVSCSIMNVIGTIILTLSQDVFLVICLGFIVALNFQILSGSFWGYLPELYPTRLRALGVSAATTVALGIGAALGPYLAGVLMASYGPSALFLLVAVASAIHAVVAWIGPETHKLPLTEN